MKEREIRFRFLYISKLSTDQNNIFEAYYAYHDPFWLLNSIPEFSKVLSHAATWLCSFRPIHMPQNCMAHLGQKMHEHSNRTGAD